MILRAPTSFLTAVIAAQAAAAGSPYLSDAVKLLYLPIGHRIDPSGVASGISRPASYETAHSALGDGRAKWERPVATGTTATAFISAGSQSLTGLPNPSAPHVPPAPQRQWLLRIPALPGLDASAGLMKTLHLNEEAAVDATPNEANWLLALGFTPYTPTSGAPVPAIA
jgi:hypothetical protein